MLSSFISLAQKKCANDAIYSGCPWFDNKGNIVGAHGGCVIKENGVYYFFGEKHYDNSNAFAGFNCYSSRDLYNWKFERLALPVQKSGKLGENRVGERVKVLKSPSTGEFVMFMHVDSINYKDQFVGYATSKKITGPYAFKGPLLFDGKPIQKWDMGAFQDFDGSGYILIHGGEIYKLSDDYKSVSTQVHKAMVSGFESPTMFRKDSIYYFLGSHLTSWERNDNYYYTSTSLAGPWLSQGLFTPEGSLTWNSQSTFVLPVAGSKDTTFIFMGDRWAYPKQASAASYVWQPMEVDGHKISIPVFQSGWKINTATGETGGVHLGRTIDNSDTKQIRYKGNWKHELSDTLSLSRSDIKGDTFSYDFFGSRVAFYGQASSDAGHALIKILNNKGKVVVSSVVDMYCKYPTSTLKFISPALKKGNYTFTVEVLGEKGNWSDKKKNVYGSTGYFVTVDKIVTSK